MQQVDVTFLRAFKVWWSFTWRVVVLWIPFEIVLVFLVRHVFHTGPHVTPAPPELRQHSTCSEFGRCCCHFLLLL